MAHLCFCLLGVNMLYSREAEGRPLAPSHYSCMLSIMMLGEETAFSRAESVMACLFALFRSHTQAMPVLWMLLIGLQS